MAPIISASSLVTPYSGSDYGRTLGSVFSGGRPADRVEEENGDAEPTVESTHQKIRGLAEMTPGGDILARSGSLAAASLGSQPLRNVFREEAPVEIGALREVHGVSGEAVGEAPSLEAFRDLSGAITPIELGALRELRGVSGEATGEAASLEAYRDLSGAVTPVEPTEGLGTDFIERLDSRPRPKPTPFGEVIDHLTGGMRPEEGERWSDFFLRLMDAIDSASLHSLAEPGAIPDNSRVRAVNVENLSPEQEVNIHVDDLDPSTLPENRGRPVINENVTIVRAPDSSPNIEVERNPEVDAASKVNVDIRDLPTHDYLRIQSPHTYVNVLRIGGPRRSTSGGLDLVS